MGKTSYVVLEEHPDDVTDYWTVYDVGVMATSASGALRTALNGKGNLESRYVAVPLRSWQPQPVEVETQHRLKIG
jgi:hypothetical protein